MTETHERTTPRDDVPVPTHVEPPPIDADESGTLAIGLMVAIVIMVALLTLALFISIPS